MTDTFRYRGTTISRTGLNQWQIEWPAGILDREGTAESMRLWVNERINDDTLPDGAHYCVDCGHQIDHEPAPDEPCPIAIEDGWRGVHQEWDHQHPAPEVTT